MSVSPQDPLPPHVYELRHKIINNNGIHIIYPLGRDFAITFKDYIDVYEGFTIRIIAYTLDSGPTYEHAIGGQQGAYALVKFYYNKPLAVMQPRSGNSYSQERNDYHGYGRFFTFAIRARDDSYYGQSFQCLVDNDSISAVAFPWSGVRHWETMRRGTNVHLSIHAGDEDGALFPTSTGLDPFLTHFVCMQTGTIAHYTGIYNGSNEIRIMATGAVKDLGRPKNAGVTIRIAIRKTLDTYTFFPDYGTEPVVAAFYNLLPSGHEYVPRFSNNFNIRQVYMEVYY